MKIMFGGGGAGIAYFYLEDVPYKLIPTSMAGNACRDAERLARAMAERDALAAKWEAVRPLARYMIEQARLDRHCDCDGCMAARQFVIDHLDLAREIEGEP